ncbi:MAG: ribbon-helix-helix protein, CopG family [Candidatus Tumulicola sp.]
MKTPHEQAPRRERLRVRLTAEEAERVTDLAAARGLSVSDFVRSTVLRAGRRRIQRRALPAGNAELIRELNAIGTDLRRLITIAQTDGSIPHGELAACLARVVTAIGGSAA